MKEKAFFRNRIRLDARIFSLTLSSGIEPVFTSVGTTRGQGIIRVVVLDVAVVATFFGHSHFLEDF